MLARFVTFGLIGLLIEVFFTGFASLAQKNYRATAQTYLWMLPVYALGGLALDFARDTLHWHYAFMAVVYVGIIYALEFCSGYVLQRLVGRCPWHYGLSHWTPMGLVNLKYLPYWYGLGLLFEPLTVSLSWAFDRLGF